MFQVLKDLYFELFGVPAASIVPIRAHASDREIFRMSGEGNSVCGVYNPHPIENEAFIYFSSHFLSHGLPVPKVLKTSADMLVYLIEDLGDVTLYDELEKTRSHEDPFPASIEKLYEKTLCYLPQFQINAARDLDFSRCFKVSEFGESSMTYDMEAFYQKFLSKTGIPINEVALRADFKSFSAYLLETPRDYFMYRDFQARNVMIRNEDPWFIDYQGGRKGPLQYDVASLLYQSSAKIPEDARMRLRDCYLEALQKVLPGSSRDQFLLYYDRYIIVRMMQVLGTYGKQGLEDGKEYFLKSIPPAVKTLHGVAKREGFITKLPELNSILEQLISHEQFGTKA